MNEWEEQGLEEYNIGHDQSTMILARPAGVSDWIEIN